MFKIITWYAIAKLYRAALLGKNPYQVAILLFIIDKYNTAYIKDTKNHRINIEITSKDFLNLMSARKFSAELKALSDAGIIIVTYALGQGTKIKVNIITKAIVDAAKKKDGLETDDILNAHTLDWSLQKDK